MRTEQHRRTGAAAWLRRVLPIVDDPDPEVVVHHERTPGMDESEVWRRLVGRREISEYRSDERDKERRRAKRKARSGRGSPSGAMAGQS